MWMLPQYLHVNQKSNYDMMMMMTLLSGSGIHELRFLHFLLFVSDPPV